MPNSPQGLRSLIGSRVLLVGTGRESLAMATRLLELDHGATLVAVDGVEGDSAVAWRERFGGRIPLHIITEDSPVPAPELALCEIAVMSPGIPPVGFLYGVVRALGCRLTSGSALFVADYGETMIGVTGSKGKSTTATLVHHLLQGSGAEVTLAGNMGTPVQSIEPGANQVVELSSYQCASLRDSPAVVVLTSLFPEHLDWHGSTEAYYADKLSILGGAPRAIIANADDEILVRELSQRHPGSDITWVGQGQQWHTSPDGTGALWLMRGADQLAHSSDIPLLGSHNVHNALLALAGAWASGLLDSARVPELLRSFQGLANRLQVIPDDSGIIFVNDSLATNPQAAIAAARALPPRQTILLLGGFDRGVDYTPLIEQIVAHPPLAVLGLPESGTRLVNLCVQALEVQGVAHEVHTESCASLAHAVALARTLAGPGDYVVLAPGAPSFGQYRDFQHRADDFIAQIAATKGHPA